MRIATADDISVTREANTQAVMLMLAGLFFVIAEVCKRHEIGGSPVFYGVSLCIALFALYTRSSLETQVVVTALLIIGVVFYLPDIMALVSPAEEPCEESVGTCLEACAEGFEEEEGLWCPRGLVCCRPET